MPIAEHPAGRWPVVVDGALVVKPKKGAHATAVLRDVQDNHGIVVRRGDVGDGPHRRVPVKRVLGHGYGAATAIGLALGQTG